MTDLPIPIATLSSSPNLVSSSSVYFLHQNSTKKMLKPSAMSNVSFQGSISRSPPTSGGPKVNAESLFSLNASQKGHYSNGNPQLNIMSSSQHSKRIIELNGTPTANNSTVASPLFPFRNRTNLQASSQNFLLQTILRDSQQIKAEYQQYKNETQAKLLEQEETIQNLKQNVELYKKKVLELRLQKEVYVAREAHAFQEIQEGIHGLLQKVSLFAQAESLKLETLPSVAFPATTERNEASNLFSFDDLVTTLKNLESKLVSSGKGQGKLSACKVMEESLKAHMALVIEKFDRIMYYVMQKQGFNSTQATSIRGDADASFYNASAEDNQDDSDACYQSPSIMETSSNTVSMEEPSPEDRVNTGNGAIFEIPTLPIEIARKSGQQSLAPNNNDVLKNRLKRKSESSCKIKSQRKRLCRKLRRRSVILEYRKNHNHEQQNGKTNGGDADEDSDQPPVLSLPCRIAKRSRMRPESMPVLEPEGALHVASPKIEPKTHVPPESRKDDALIGIKRENFSSVLHGKDFSKLGFVCLCGAKFTGAGGLYVHQVKTMENEKFSCRSCGKKFHYFSGLKAHRKSAHKQEFTQEVGCSRCGQVFKSKKDRQGHVDVRGQTCWLSGSYQSKDWEAIRSKRNLSSSSSCTSSSASSSQNNVI